MIKISTRIQSVLGIVKYTTFFLLFFILTFTFTVSAQKAGPVIAKTDVDTSDSNPSTTTAPGTLSEDGSTYVSRDGKTYKKGESIIFIAGTGVNGVFLNTSLIVFGLPLSERFLAGKAAGEEVEILEFKKEKIGLKRIYAIVKVSNTKFAVFIESSLATKEIR